MRDRNAALQGALGPLDGRGGATPVASNLCGRYATIADNSAHIAELIRSVSDRLFGSEPKAVGGAPNLASEDAPLQISADRIDAQLSVARGLLADILDRL